MAGHYRKLQVNVQQVTGERVVHYLALLHQFAVPQILQLLGKRVVHLATKNLAQVLHQLVLAVRAKHLEGLLVHVDHADFLHAARDKLGVHFQKGLEIADAAAAHLVEQAFDFPEILHPQGDGRVFKQIAGVMLATLQLLGASHFGGDVFQRDQDTAPAVFIAGQDLTPDLNVERIAPQVVVDGAVFKAHLPVPQRQQLGHEFVEHGIPKHFAQTALQRGLVGGLKQLQRVLVDAQHFESGAAARQPGGVGLQEGQEIGDAFGTPLVKQPFEFAVIFHPQRNWREIEHVLKVQSSSKRIRHCAHLRRKLLPTSSGRA